MGVLELFRNNNNKIFNEDGIGIRTMKEQNEYIKSPEYQRILKDLEELKEYRKTRYNRTLKNNRKYGNHRRKLEKEIYDLTHIEGNIKSNYLPIKIDRIPKITLDGKIIEPFK